MKKIKYVAIYLNLVAGCILYSNQASADTSPDFFQSQFYLGSTAGYGRTTWQGLVPPAGKQNEAIVMFVPTRVKEGGLVFGIFGGYEFHPYFALDVAYMRYPDAEVTFDKSSLFAFEHDGRLSFKSHTDSLLLMSKIMMPFLDTPLRVYSSFGIAAVRRRDEVRNRLKGAPAFGAGFNYAFTQQMMGEFGGIYSAGYGQSELDPTDTYIPFLYSIVLRLAYRFSL